jgi:hypothetical protein
MNNFKTWFVVGTWGSQKWFDVNVLDFESEFWWIYFVIFSLGNSFGYFLQKLGIFSFILPKPLKYHLIVASFP